MDECVIEKRRTLSQSEIYLRADKIDLKNWDIQLEKHLSGVVLSKGSENQKPKEAWEIDMAKLDIKYVIDRGAFGTVYRGAYDGQDVAVKILDLGETAIATARETTALLASFQQEVAVWHKLDHPNVTKFVGASVGTLNLKLSSEDKSSDNHMTPRACVVLEYVPGGTLKKFLIRNRRKKLSFQTVIQLALDLSRGLSYLHSRKTVHRDVKTENMLLDTCRKVKITDFGVARIEAQNLMDMTGETGTLGYMAPEVFDGKPYNRKCDVYSFGICLWEIYCCDMPYPSGQHNSRPEIPRCCPSSLANIMKRCWDANPDKRPDMDEVVRLLEAIDTTKGRGMIPEDQATIQGFEAKGYSNEESEALLWKSVEIAREARDVYYKRCAISSSGDKPDGRILKQRQILIAASVGSYGAYLADGSEYRFWDNGFVKGLKANFERGSVTLIINEGVAERRQLPSEPYTERSPADLQLDCP